MNLPRKVWLTQVLRYSECKCTGAGNGRKQSRITARLRRQVNKKRRRVLKVEMMRGY